jgi:hypothetical protein
MSNHAGRTLGTESVGCRTRLDFPLGRLAEMDQYYHFALSIETTENYYCKCNTAPIPV